VELLDAAHILPDGHPKGEPVVPNGLALCKLHHAAFDRQRLAALEHLEDWCARNQRSELLDGLIRRSLPHQLHRTERVASWAYLQAERMGAGVWRQGRGPLERLPETTVEALAARFEKELTVPWGVSFGFARDWVGDYQAGYMPPPEEHQNGAVED
jgi:hypothetical protein